MLDTRQPIFVFIADPIHHLAQDLANPRYSKVHIFQEEDLSLHPIVQFFQPLLEAFPGHIAKIQTREHRQKHTTIIYNEWVSLIFLQ
jgi:hypothetical protein